jgi:hypothetical protein
MNPRSSLQEHEKVQGNNPQEMRTEDNVNTAMSGELAMKTTPQSQERKRVGSFSDESWRIPDSTASLLDADVMIVLKNIKSTMVLSPNHRWPIATEGLLLEHHVMPLAAHMEIILTAADREIIHEEFSLPTNQREEVTAAHRKLAEVSSDFLTNAYLRDRAMLVYYPELAEEFDLWYRLSIDEHGMLDYAIHIGPSNNQDIKKRIEGTLQL